MSADTIYQQLREHLAYLRLPAIAEQLAPALEAADHDKPGYTGSSKSCSPRRSTRSPSAACRAGCGSQSSPPARRSSSSTSPPNHRWTAASSKTSPRCASSKRRQT